MSVTLTQSEAAAFPDRPLTGGVGLLATMAAGDDGAFVSHTLDVAPSALHTRFLLNREGFTAGRAVLVRALSMNGDETLRLLFDADAGELTLTPAAGQGLTAALPTQLAWHCIELMIDTADGEAALYINGKRVDQAIGGFASLLTTQLQLGVIYKDVGATGELLFDEWCIADSYIGPVVVEPVSDYADDPSRWLVLYSANAPDSATWAEMYRATRGVPYANLLGLDLSSDEVIDAAAYAALNDSISDYLSRNHLQTNIAGVLCGYGVPGYADFTGNGTLDAVPALLARDLPAQGLRVNANATVDLPQRPPVAQLNGDRLTARIDAPTFAEALALIDRATHIIGQGVGDEDDATLFFDPFITPGPVSEPVMQSWLAWAVSTDRMHTRLPFVFSGDPEVLREAAFESIANDGFFWGWSQVAPPSGFFAEPAGQRICCVQLDPTAPTATTLRSTAARSPSSAP